MEALPFILLHLLHNVFVPSCSRVDCVVLHFVLTSCLYIFFKFHEIPVFQRFTCLFAYGGTCKVSFMRPLVELQVQVGSTPSSRQLLVFDGEVW